MLELERSQSVVLKVALFKPRLLPIKDLYSEARVPTVFVPFSMIRQHTMIVFKPEFVFPSDRIFKKRIMPIVCVKQFIIIRPAAGYGSPLSYGYSPPC